MKMTNIVITGGYGILGRELADQLRYYRHMINDYVNFGYIYQTLGHDIDDLTVDVDLSYLGVHPDLIIHCAALKVGSKFELCNNNIKATLNVVNYARVHASRLIYISTDYVYPGITGNYDVTDSLNPVNYYAKTKLAGEYITQSLDNYLIIRTSFYPKDQFPYTKAYVDKFTSKDYVNRIVTLMIPHIIKFDQVGIINVGRVLASSEYELAREVMPNIEGISMPPGMLPRDSSMKIEEDEVDEYWI